MKLNQFHEYVHEVSIPRTEVFPTDRYYTIAYMKNDYVTFHLRICIEEHL